MEEEFEDDAVVRALYAAVDQYHADIINMSWTVNVERPALYNAIRYAYESGVILVASVGNVSLSTGFGSAPYPAAWEEVIGVGGVNLDEEGKPVPSLMYLQNDSVFVCACAEWDGEKGSSFAAPRVAAMITEYLSGALDMVQDDVRRMLMETATDMGVPGWDPIYGWGYIDVRI